VVSDLCEKLQACRGNEPRTLHRARRLASANTSSAEIVCSSPRS
jgi:hypothetical protein